MRKLLLCTFLMLWAGLTYAQTVSSRNNYTGQWTKRASWMQEWPGIATTTPLPAGSINLYGYISHGTLSAGANITLAGSGNELKVYDTLRVHGNLIITQYAHLTIEAGGVLVVHGNYVQHDWARLTNRGKMIVLGELKLLGSTYATNTGDLYVGSASGTGGWNLNEQTLATLATADPTTSYFTTTNVITSVCSGTNTGTLTYTGLGSIIRWESSTDHFKSDIQPIAHTLTQYTYTNLSKTTSYRVYYNRAGVLGYSNGATVLVESSSAGGQVSGPEETCGAGNPVTFSLANQTGAVVRWEWSTTSNFAAGTVQTKVTTEERLTLSGLTDFTYIRAVVKNGSCSEAYSSTHYLKAYPATNGGSLSGPAALCLGTSSGTITLGSHKGNVLRWELSADNFATDVRTISTTDPELSISNLTATTWYRAVVKSGPCDMAYSQPHRVEVQDLKGGTLTGPDRVCAGSNSGTVRLQDYSGTIIRGEWSHDGFQNHIQVSSYTQDTYTFSNLTQDTWFRAVVSSGCGQTYSTEHIVRVDQSSLAGSLSGPASVCKGVNTGTLSLSGHRGAILRWESSGDNFVTDTQVLATTGSSYSFSNLTADRWFRAVVQNGSCAPATSASFRVRVSELAGGTLSGPASLCQGAGGQLTLSGHIGQIIRWESSTDNFTSNIQPIASTTSSFAVASLATTTWYRAVLGTADCGQTYSASWTIAVEQPSLAGTLSGTQAVCAPTNTGTLQLQGHQGAIVRWETSSDNFVSQVQHIAHTAASYTYSNLTADRWYRVLIQNGSCSPAYTQHIRVTVTPASQGGTLAGAATVCPGANSGTLSLQGQLGQVLRWESSTDNFASLTTIDHSATTLSYQNLTATTAYRAVVQNGDCNVVYSNAVSITVRPLAQAGRVEGEAVVIAGDNSGNLQLLEYSGQIIRWESSTDNFVSNIQAIANTTPLQPYQDLAQTSWYRAVVSDGSCGEVYSLAARIRVNRAPIARNDTLLVTANPYTASLSVLQNDTDPDGDPLRARPLQLTTAAGGTATLGANGILSYQPPAHYLGLDSLRYTVCDEVPGASLCAEALIVLDVRMPAAPLVVYQGVSPNGDGRNDFWMIEHIERYPENRVQLYDRYGTLVFEMWGYDNQDKCFSGQANRGIRPGGNQLPEGTYFYKISTGPAAPQLKGYIVLKN